MYRLHTCDVCYLFSELPITGGTLWRGVFKYNGGLPGAIAASLVLTNQPALFVCGVCVCVCVYTCGVCVRMSGCGEYVWVCVHIITM